jgi:hypothetical protein
MTAAAHQIRGYHPPFVWNANGLLSLFTPAPAAVALVPADILDGTRECPTGLLIDAFVLHLVYDGTAGTGSNTFEVWRRRAGANTLLATLTIASAAGSYSRVAVVPASTALRTLNVLDKLYVQPTAAATAAYDATIEGQFT